MYACPSLSPHRSRTADVSGIIMLQIAGAYEGVSVLFEPGLLSATVCEFISGFELVGVSSLGEKPCWMCRKSMGALMSIRLIDALRDLGRGKDKTVQLHSIIHSRESV